MASAGCWESTSRGIGVTGLPFMAYASKIYECTMLGQIDVIDLLRHTDAHVPVIQYVPVIISSHLEKADRKAEL